MELRVVTPERLTFARRGVLAPGLVAVPLVVLGLVPLTSQITLLRVLTGVALVFLAVVCTKMELPWSHRVQVSLKAGQLRRRGRVVPLEAAQAWVLVAGGCGSAGRYEISLELRDGSTWPVLTGSDPAAVLEQLARALARLDLPVRPGWGLPDDARPWDAWEGSVRAGSWLPPETRPVSWPVQADQHRITWALGVGGTLVALILAVIGAARVAKAEPIAVLSAGLAVGLVVLLLSITLAVATDRVTLNLKPRLAIRHQRFGFWTVSQADLAETQWRRGYIVEAGAERHLLLETSTGPRAFPCQPRLQLPELQAVLARGRDGRGVGHVSARRTEAQHARLAL